MIAVLERAASSLRNLCRVDPPRRHARQFVRDLLICVSLANLLLLDGWRHLLGRTYYEAAIEPSHFLAVMIVSLMLAGVLWAGMQLARRCGRAGVFFAKWLFFQILALCVYGWLAPLISPGRGGALAILVLCVPVLLLVPRSLPRGVGNVLLALSPCVAFLFLRGAWSMVNVHPPNIVQGSFNRLGTEGPRVLLVVFDEMSQSAAFGHRPNGVEMPAFDRLRDEAVVATGAYPPGSATLVSMPALLTGEAIRQVQPVTERELRIRYTQDGRFESLSASPTVFSDVHALGLGTAMIGWYHPYCSVLSDLDFCTHVKAGIAVPGIYERQPLSANVVEVVSWVPVLRASNWTQRRREQRIRETHEWEDSILTAATRDVLAEFRSGLIVVHLAVPHPPAVHAPGMLFSNLTAADRKLAEIKSIMQHHGTWDSTAVLVTSDHSWRAREWKSWSLWTASEKAYIQPQNDYRVPFIMKLPGEKSSDTYTRKFNVLLSRNLIRDVLKGNVTTPAALKDWLDLHRGDAPVTAYALQ